MIDKILRQCNFIYKQLGSSHNECIYQKALCSEIQYIPGLITVESEKHVPVFYKDTRGNLLTLGDERIDILVKYTDEVNTMYTKYLLIELKATQSGIRDHVEMKQLKKYIHALSYIKILVNDAMVINFPQQRESEQIEYKKINIIPNENHQDEGQFHSDYEHDGPTIEIPV
jgi:hypothetical protein